MSKVLTLVEHLKLGLVSTTTEMLTEAVLVTIHRILILSNGDGLIKILLLTQVGAGTNLNQIVMPRVVLLLTVKVDGVLPILATLPRPVFDSIDIFGELISKSDIFGELSSKSDIFGDSTFRGLLISVICHVNDSKTLTAIHLQASCGT